MLQPLSFDGTSRFSHLDDIERVARRALRGGDSQALDAAIRSISADLAAHGITFEGRTLPVSLLPTVIPAAEAERISWAGGRVRARLRHEDGVRVSHLLDDSIQEVWLDPEIFYDALLNLVVNAMEAIPEGREGQVQVTTKRLSGRKQVLIEVLDNGPGIPEELRAKVFNLFFTTKGKKGTGIGLASARKTIEAHGGTIELAPPAPGEGAHFMIYLPINPPEALDHQSKGESPTSPMPTPAAHGVEDASRSAPTRRPAPHTTALGPEPRPERAASGSPARRRSQRSPGRGARWALGLGLVFVALVAGAWWITRHDGTLFCSWAWEPVLAILSAISLHFSRPLPRCSLRSPACCASQELVSLFCPRR